MNPMVMFVQAVVSVTSEVIYYTVVDGLRNTGRVTAHLTPFSSNAYPRSNIYPVFLLPYEAV